jgi:ADP-ribose pyrophosphatase YjhB (NUDIX family)
MSEGTRSQRARSQANPPSPEEDPKRWPVRRAESYGGVVLRTTEARSEVVLIRTKNLKGKDAWSLPKGGREEGEMPEAAALREVREETGIDAEIVEPLEDITYWFIWPPEQVRYRKTVHLYLMRAVGGDTSMHDDEVEEARFVPLDEAERMVTYRTDRKVLRTALDRVRDS